MFKVGDWITISKGKAWKATAFDVAHLELDNDVELWQPKEGEWCWFHNLYSPCLSKYRQTRTVMGRSIFIDQYGDEFTDIEPFIGELPNFLKDK